MKLRKLITILMVAVLVLSTVGCGEKKEEQTTNTNSNKDSTVVKKDDTGTKETTPTTPAKTDEKITLRMAWWGSQTRHDRTVAVIDMYMKENPNIVIEYEPMDYDSYFNKLNTLVASNEVWDIFQLGSNFPTYESKIHYLNDFIKDGTIDVSDTTDAFLRIAADVKGNQVGLSSGVNTYGIAIDAELFAAAGIEIPKDNWTWDDFADISKKIYDKLGIYGCSKLDDWIAGASMNISQTSFDNGFFNADNSGLGFDDYTMLTDYIKMRSELVDYKAYPDPGALAEITDIENDFIVTGEAAMTWIASNQFISLCQAAGKELLLINPPRRTADGPAGVTIQSSQMLCASTDSKHPEEAAKFIAFFQSSVEANKILLGERGIPTFYAVREALASQLTETDKTIYKYLDLVGSFDTGDAPYNPAAPAAGEAIREQYGYLLDKVIFKELSADDAAKQLYDFAKTQQY